MAEPYELSSAVAQAEAVLALATGAEKAQRARDEAIAEEADARARTAELRAYHDALTMHVTALESRLADLRGGLSLEERQMQANLAELKHTYDLTQQSLSDLQRAHQVALDDAARMVRRAYGGTLGYHLAQPRQAVDAGMPNPISGAEAFKTTAPTPVDVPAEAQPEPHVEATAWEVEA